MMMTMIANNKMMTAVNTPMMIPIYWSSRLFLLWWFTSSVVPSGPGEGPVLSTEMDNDDREH